MSARLTIFPDRATRRARRLSLPEIEDVAGQIADLARSSAPVLTGAYRNRIGVEVEGRGRIVRASARVAHVEVRLSQHGAERATGRFSFAIMDQAGAERLLERPLPEPWLRFCRG